MSSFWVCKCGTKFPYGTMAERVINHINGSYHKKRIKMLEAGK